ncbi:hypothetical protein SCATT_57430 [Streptantibioticus cattleyicolor NRRL 8057 = DSM 46488]|uniref:Uncharacterized protein n=1 Tax=Streptantibioticus cattleyicolor (strain ATCC 35852 / DSM 46488 / JCM 4925 / NBRC 14057 / NRRL 8057) TaxID=1003195 RepID=G8WYI4_STREN|nr:hypothetical protein SCATT_57430 [Streptantibioticus cattleyicolor NRRL 8057 = DSM 46488]
MLPGVRELGAGKALFEQARGVGGGHERVVDPVVGPRRPRRSPSRRCAGPPDPPTSSLRTGTWCGAVPGG